MLGAQRANVTEALRPLRNADVVKSYRRRITILNDAGVEAPECECYFVVRNEYDRLLDRGDMRRRDRTHGAAS